MKVMDNVIALLRRRGGRDLLRLEIARGKTEDEQKTNRCGKSKPGHSSPRVVRRSLQKSNDKKHTQQQIRAGENQVAARNALLHEKHDHGHPVTKLLDHRRNHEV